MLCSQEEHELLAFYQERERDRKVATEKLRQQHLHLVQLASVVHDTALRPSRLEVLHPLEVMWTFNKISRTQYILKKELVEL